MSRLRSKGSDRNQILTKDKMNENLISIVAVAIPCAFYVYNLFAAKRKASQGVYVYVKADLKDIKAKSCHFNGTHDV